MKKAAIMGWWYNQNYGSILTYYALNKYVQNKGYETVMIDGPLGYKNRSNFRAWMPLAYNFFKKNNMPYTEQLTKETLPTLNDLENLDTFILGSDQMWNPWNGWVDDDDFLDFVYPRNKTIAYSVSLGKADTSKYDPKWVANRKKDITQFNHVSMREDFSVQIMKDIFQEEVIQALDPTYLVERSEYDSLADQATFKRQESGDYMAVFFLDINKEKVRVALAIAEKLGLKLVVLPNPLKGRELAKKTFPNTVEYVSEDTPENFLAVYREAKYIITDSFHGTVFATIFQKPFSIFYNEQRGIDRFNSLMNLFELGETRRVYEQNTKQEIEENKNISLALDYQKTAGKIAREKEISDKWLTDALTSKFSPDEDEVYDEFRRYIINKPLDFYRAKTTVPISAAIVLSPNGTIKNSNPNESFWKLIDKELIFMNNHREVTTRFNREKFKGKETFSPFRIVGKYVKDEKIEHVMYLHPIQKPKPKPKQGTEKKALAIPENLLTRKQLIMKIVQNERIRSWKQDLLEELPDLELFVGRELKEYASNFVGGPADLLIFPKTIEEVALIVKYAKNNQIPLTVIGKGSNILVRDGGIRGITLNMTALNYRKITGNVLTVSAGASLIETSYYLLEHLKCGLEWADNIPGTIGGAVYMNAGTVKDINSMFLEATIVDENGEIKVLNKEDVQFSHRYSSFMDHPEWIILETKLQISEGNLENMVNDMVGTVEIRERMHPLTHPNHGSTFTWGRAPRLIQQAGLVGTRIGGVKVSEKHPGFFINVEQASAQDYEALIYLIIAKVYEFSGFLLKPEVRILGANMWEASLTFK